MARILIHVGQEQEIDKAGIDSEGLSILTNDIKSVLGIEDIHAPDALAKIQSLTYEDLRGFAHLGHDCRKVYLAATALGLYAAGHDVRFLKSDEPMPDAVHKFNVIFLTSEKDSSRGDFILNSYKAEKAKRVRQVVSNCDPQMDYTVLIENMNSPDFVEMKMYNSSGPDTGCPLIFSPVYNDLHSYGFHTLLEKYQVPTVPAYIPDEEIAGCEKIFTGSVPSLYMFSKATVIRNVKNAAGVDALGLPAKHANEIKQMAAIKEQRSNPPQNKTR